MIYSPLIGTWRAYILDSPQGECLFSWRPEHTWGIYAHALIRCDNAKHLRDRLNDPTRICQALCTAKVLVS